MSTYCYAHGVVSPGCTRCSASGFPQVVVLDDGVTVKVMPYGWEGRYVIEGHARSYELYEAAHPETAVGTVETTAPWAQPDADPMGDMRAMFASDGTRYAVTDESHLMTQEQLDAARPWPDIYQAPLMPRPPEPPPVPEFDQVHTERDWLRWATAMQSFRPIDRTLDWLSDHEKIEMAVTITFVLMLLWVVLWLS